MTKRSKKTSAMDDAVEKTDAATRQRRAAVFGAVVALVLAIVAITYATMNANSRRDDLLMQSNRIDMLKGQINVAQTTANSEKETITEEATGMQASRKRADDKKMSELLTQATTWSSYQQYVDARAAVLRAYGIQPESDFGKTFLPVVPNTTDRTGKKFNVIDTQGYSVAFDSLDSSVSGVRSTDYQYFALVTLKVKASSKATAVPLRYVVTYTTTVDHKFKDMAAQAVPVAPSTTGK